jgi:hypothetical protein
MELIRDGKHEINHFNEYRFDLLINTILPSQNTMLHYLVGNQKQLEELTSKLEKLSVPD